MKRYEYSVTWEDPRGCRCVLVANRLWKAKKLYRELVSLALGKAARRQAVTLWKGEDLAVRRMTVYGDGSSIEEKPNRAEGILEAWHAFN